MLSELKRYCQYKDNGCGWIGELGQCEAHERECVHAPTDTLLAIIRQQRQEIADLRRQLVSKDERVEVLQTAAPLCLLLLRGSAKLFLVVVLSRTRSN